MARNNRAVIELVATEPSVLGLTLARSPQFRRRPTAVIVGLHSVPDHGYRSGRLAPTQWISELAAMKGHPVEIIVGVTQDASSQDALALARALRAPLTARLTACNCYPVAYDYLSPAHVDAEWHGFLVERAHEALESARRELAQIPDAEFCIRGHRSSGLGLIEVAEQREAGLIVIGSAPGGNDGRIHGGSTADQLLHGAPVPVAIAPHGYRNWAPPQITRFVVAYRPDRESEHALELACGFAANSQTAVQIEIVTVVERTTRAFGSRLGKSAEDQVLSRLRNQAGDSLAAACRRAESLGVTASGTVLEGDSITSAIARFDWRDADLFALGSTEAGPLRRVFLGDMTYKLMRAAPVPILVVPRS